MLSSTLWVVDQSEATETVTDRWEEEHSGEVDTNNITDFRTTNFFSLALFLKHTHTN